MKQSSTQAIYSDHELDIYGKLIQQKVATLRTEVLEATIQQLTHASIQDFVKEAGGLEWHELLSQRITQYRGKPSKQLPSEEECQLFETLVLFMQDLQKYGEEMLQKQTQQHSRVLASMEFESRSNRLYANRAIEQLKDQLNQKSTSLLTVSKELAQQREQARQAKHQLLSEISRLKDEVCMKDSTIGELNRKVREFTEQLQDMEKVVDWADYNADLMRLQTYRIGIQQQQLYLGSHITQLKQVFARNRMHQALYKCIEQMNLEASNTNCSLAGEVQALERLANERSVDTNPNGLLWECQQTLSRVNTHCYHRYEKLKLEHEQKALEWEREQARKEHNWSIEKIKLSSANRQLESELKVQGDQLAKLVTLTSNLEGDCARERNHNAELEREALTLKGHLQSAQSDIKMLRTVIKGLQESNESLRIEKTSLRENLMLISQAGNRQKETQEEDSAREKGIVEQVVERNFEYKLRNRELDCQLQQLRENYDRLREEFQNDARQYSQINDNLKQEVLMKNDMIDRLRSEIKDKEHYVQHVSEKIEVVEGQLGNLQELHHSNSQLEDKCREFEVALAETLQREGNLQQQLKRLTCERASLEAENRFWKEREVIIVEHSKKSQLDEERIIKLSEDLEDAQQQIRQLQEQLNTATLSLAAANTEISQTKDKLAAQEKLNIDKPSVDPYAETMPRGGSLSRNPNLQETLKAKENIHSSLKEKYTQSILNLNELVNFLMNSVKGYTFSGESRIREGSWIWQQGAIFLKKMQSPANLQGKLRNYLRVRQLASADPKIRQVCDTFCGIMDGYYQRLHSSQLN